jgi:hypothetical protein
MNIAWREALLLYLHGLNGFLYRDNPCSTSKVYYVFFLILFLFLLLPYVYSVILSGAKDLSRMRVSSETNSEILRLSASE